MRTCRTLKTGHCNPAPNAVDREKKQDKQDHTNCSGCHALDDSYYNSGTGLVLTLGGIGCWNIHGAGVAQLQKSAMSNSRAFTDWWLAAGCSFNASLRYPAAFENCSERRWTSLI